MAELGEFFLQSDRMCLFIVYFKKICGIDRRRRKFSWFVDLEHIFLKYFGCIPRVELHNILSIFNRVADLGEFYNRVLASGRLRRGADLGENFRKSQIAGCSSWWVFELGECLL